MTINYLINELLDYGLEKNILNMDDFDYSCNLLIDLFLKKDFIREKTTPRDVDLILNDLANLAYENEIILSKDVVTVDNFKSKTVDIIIDRPQTVINKFYQLHHDSPISATNYLYQLSKDTNYIQTKRIAQNILWQTKTEYGYLDLTINLSKPEKDPKLIALQKTQKSNAYPKCQLCKENQGYRGHLGYDARSNMRIIPIVLNNEKWYFQYSPYSYFNEHSIVLNEQHIPMVINNCTFHKLVDFLDLFPGYFVGSNAGLPIVGGSILDHEHYQSGKYHFPIEEAKAVEFSNIDDVSVYKLIWPLSTIRLTSKNKEKIIRIATKVLNLWQQYQNPDLDLFNSIDNIHHTITPISRKNNEEYVFDLILRSNYTNEQFPDGVFHPHPELYHIKKENIGLIEAMGMGILPPRLKQEFALIEQVLLGDESLLNEEALKKHLHWIDILKAKYKPNLDLKKFILEETSIVFSNVLKDAGVFKMDVLGNKAFDQFILSLYK